MTGYGALDELATGRRIVICAGPGGVGKTTTAAALALHGATIGRRTIVVTIDPARRLADALGVAGLGDAPVRLDGGWPGELWALVLDSERTFDALVAKHATDPEQAERILSNRFYRNVAGAVSGTHEYMAMEKLYELHEEGDFDLIVVDTPPTRNALDFVDAPRRLTRFLEHRLFRVIATPGRSSLRAANVAAQALLRTTARVVGREVVDDVTAFFAAFSGMEEGFRERAERVRALLASAGTAFVLVTAPLRDVVTETTFFADQLAAAGIGVDAVVANRMHPDFGGGPGEATRARSRTLEGTALGTLYRNLAEFQLVAAREAGVLDDVVEHTAPAPVVRVPFLDTDVHDLAGLERIRRLLVEEPAGGRSTGRPPPRTRG